MQFGTYNETPEFVNTLLLGKNLFDVIAVNPSLTQLQKMKEQGINVFVPEKDPVYVGKTSSTFGGPEDTAYFDARFYLRHVDDPKLIFQATYRVLNTQEQSKDGVKWRIINNYGQTAWIPQAEIDAKVAPSAPAFFISTDGFRKAYKGEENLIKFFRAFLNYPVVANPTPDKDGKMRKAIDIDKRKDYLTGFDVASINEMLGGKFEKLQAVVVSNPKGNVGLLSGVRTTTNDEGKEKQYQAFYTDEPLRKYNVEKSSGDNYLLKSLTDATDNGRYANVYFGTHSMVGRIFDPKEMPSANAGTTSSNPFGDTPSGFSAPNTESNPFATPPTADQIEDDLPF